MADHDPPSAPPSPNPVPSLEGLFPRPHPSCETLFMLGVAAMVLGPLAGIPAILLGRLVLRETTGSDGRYTGESRARLGVGLGWAGTQVHTLLLLYLIGATSELVALAVLGAGVVVGLIIAVGESAAGAPRPFAAAARASRRAPWGVYPAVVGLLGVGVAGFITKRRVDERARMEAAVACEQARRGASGALETASFALARSHLKEARRTCVDAMLQEVARAETEVDAREREATRRRAEEEAARKARQRAEEEQARAEREQRAAARFQDVAPTIARHLQVASTRAAQRRWEDARAALSQAELALDEIRGTGVEQSERGAALLAQAARLRPDVDAGVEQIRRRREEEERRRQALREAAEERQRQMKAAAEERQQRMREAADERRQASLRVQCCDGTLSPSCLCARASYRGCCSHHGGVCGCEE